MIAISTAYDGGVERGEGRWDVQWMEHPSWLTFVHKRIKVRPVPDQRNSVEFFTVGYEGRTLDEFIEILAAVGVNRVVDVRELPLSRKRGFSKTALSEALAKHGIDYVHVRAAGNPHRDMRQDIKRCLAAYRQHLRDNPDAVDEVMDAIDGARAALLCVEHEPFSCHRSVLASRLARRRNVTIAAHL